MTECSSVGRAIDCSVAYCVSVFSEINWSLVRFRPLGFCLQAFGWLLPSISFARSCLLLSSQTAMMLSVMQRSDDTERTLSLWHRHKTVI